MTPEEFTVALRKARASAILRVNDTDVARKAMEAAIRGGFHIIEFTMSIPHALELVKEFSRRDGLVVGAGTILSAGQVREAVKAGARFIVSPVVDEAVIKAAEELRVAVMPGAFTPLEMLRAHRAGAPLIKLFPAPSTGPAYVKQILGPFPEFKIVPTSGVDASNARAYLEAGCWAVGFVASLFAAEDLAAGRYDAIEDRTRRFLRAVTP